MHLLYNIYKILEQECEIILKSYNIAVIIAGIDESYQNEILNGIEKFASERPITLATFVSFSGTMNNHSHDTGELNIFNLPDFRLFDAAILLTNTIDYTPIVTKILNGIKAAAIPAINIDRDIPGFFSICIDNSMAMRRIAEHFIQKHKFKTINYISGPTDNPESTDRLNSFLQVMRENNLPIEEERIFFGDFRAGSGKQAIHEFLSSDLEMPEAIICANDVMAISAMNALTLAGYEIPKDIAVSGFDNTYSARNYPTELTSVERPLELSGKLACEILYNHLNGIPQERCTMLECGPHFTESCGCTNVTFGDLDSFKNLNYNNFIKFEQSSDYLSLINRMSCELVECDSFAEYINSLKPFITEIQAEEFYLCICDDWTIDSSKKGEPTQNDFKKFTIDGYTNNILVPLAYKNGIFTKCPSFSSKEILPELFEPSEKSRSYYFIPLHFRERCLGYMAIMNSRFPLDSSMFQTWCVNISNTLENIRKIIYLDEMINKLDRLYTVDTLSGIYNRNGFVKNTTSPYNNCVDKKLPVMLMFLDMDGLKHINDTLGHHSGDDAIRDLAEAMRKSCTGREVFCRFGGDEFIVFGAEYTDVDAQALTNRIQENIKYINENYQNPYTLSASIGYHITRPDPGIDIFQLVTIADNIMYVEKKKKKMSRYLKT